MKTIKVPEPQLNSHMQGMIDNASNIELLEVATRKFFARPVVIYYQGSFCPKAMRKLKAITKLLAEGKWTLDGIKPDLKSVVFIMNEGQVKMQCNFNRSLPDMPFVKLGSFRERNPLIVYSYTKRKRSLDLYFKEVTVNKEMNHEC